MVLKRLLCLVCTLFMLGSFSLAEDVDISCEWQILKLDVQANEGEPRYHAIIEVKNTSERDLLYLGFARYDVYDAEGMLIASDDSSVWGTPPVLTPGAVGYYHTNHYIELPVGCDPAAEYSLVPDMSVMRIVDGGATDFEVYEPQFSCGKDAYPTVMGRLENDADEDKDVHVQLILLDANGEIVDVVYTVECVPANGSLPFVLEDYKMFGRTDIADYRVYAQHFDLNYLY